LAASDDFMGMRALLATLGRVLFVVLAGAVLSATLVRLAPGAGVSEEQLDVRWNQESRSRALEREHEELNLARYYWRYIRGWLHADFGMSHSLQRPVGELLKDRLRPTAQGIGLGLLVAWGAGLAAAVFSATGRTRWVDHATLSGAVFLQCVPAGVLGLVLLACGGRGATVCGAALGLLLYPRVRQYAANILASAYGSPHVHSARARGVGAVRLFLWHVLPVAFPQVVAFAGVSVSLGISAAIPLEVILDVPGLGQLAWQAALARDLNLTVNVTVLVSLAVVIANTVSDTLVRCSLRETNPV
jgi:peptide/nickel transport system permease protein